jgi:hypothetical protein
MLYQYIPSPAATGLTQFDAGPTGPNRADRIGPVKSSQSGASPVPTGLVVGRYDRSYLFSPASPVFSGTRFNLAASQSVSRPKFMPLGALDCNKLANLLETEDSSYEGHR